LTGNSLVLGNPAISERDPWLSGPALLQVWLFLAITFLILFRFVVLYSLMTIAESTYRFPVPTALLE